MPAPTPFRLLALFALLACMRLAPGCASPCLDVQAALCDCQGTTQDERNACLDRAKEQEKLSPPTEDELKVCETLLPGCEALLDGGKTCDRLQTSEGRIACGLSKEASN